MSGLFSNILTNTTSRYQNLRQQLLNSEADGDTEDDSHISRVLRAYYTEKGRPFPQWLPPDPKAPQAAPTQFASSRQQGQMQPTGGRGGGLSDLWDTPQQQQQPQEPLSLRRGPGARGGGGGARPLQGRAGMGNSLTPEPQSQGRPLPSQRAGSYQSSLQGGRQTDASPPPSAGSGSTAQERLKARLWGRSNSPAPSAASDTGSQASRMGAYDRPAPQGGRAPYLDERNNSYGSTGGGGGGGRQQSSSGMSANSPWTGNDDPYGPGYDRGPPQRGPAGGRVGLPSGPRMR